MNWKFWQNTEEPELVIETQDVPTSTLLRWFLYDCAVPNPNKHAELLGFTPISAEGEEMEIKESRERLAKIEPFIDFIALMSDISGQVMAESSSELLKAAGLEDLDIPEDEGYAALADMYTSVAISCLVPAFSAALKLGILVNPGTYVTEAIHER